MTNLFAWDYEQEFNWEIGTKWDAHVLQASVLIPLALYIRDKQNKKKEKIEQGIHG